ncbi:hypothetical protein WM009_21975, partial [Vibrio vulnificus]|uniref:hypothetical protein n=1 Tax=Vibrio vulnificus TaxID=672 RepID=UPI0030EE3F9F
TWGCLWPFVYGFQQASLACPKSSRFFNHFSCQNSWVASLKIGDGWVKVSLAQRRFRFINRLNKIVVLSLSHLAVKLSEILGIGSAQCGNLAGFFAKWVKVKQYNLTRNSSLTTNAWLNLL